MNVCVQSHIPPALPLGKMPQVPTEQEAGWARDLTWKPYRNEKYHDPARNQPQLLIHLSRPQPTNHTNCTIVAPVLESVLS
jgi:hypothetical protein